MKITLPSLELTLNQKTGSKNINIIRELLVSKRLISLNILLENSFYLVIENNGNKICITTKEGCISNKIQYNLVIK